MSSSVVGTIFTTALGTGHWGSLAGAAVCPVVSAAFSAWPERGAVRSAIIIILSIIALLTTVTGFTVADRVAGKSVLPGPDPQSGIFVPVNWPDPGPSPSPSPTSTSEGPSIQTQPKQHDWLDCGTAAVGEATACTQPVRIISNGTEALHITGIKISGFNKQDFIVSQDCVGRRLHFGEICELQVSFKPTLGGLRQATLTIHQNIPFPDQGTQVELKGTGIGPTPTPTLTPTPTPTLTPTPTGSPSTSASALRLKPLTGTQPGN